MEVFEWVGEEATEMRRFAGNVVSFDMNFYPRIPGVDTCLEITSCTSYAFHSFQSRESLYPVITSALLSISRLFISRARTRSSLRF